MNDITPDIRDAAFLFACRYIQAMGAPRGDAGRSPRARRDQARVALRKEIAAAGWASSPAGITNVDYHNGVVTFTAPDGSVQRINVPPNVGRAHVVNRAVVDTYEVYRSGSTLGRACAMTFTSPAFHGDIDAFATIDATMIMPAGSLRSHSDAVLPSVSWRG